MMVLTARENVSSRSAALFINDSDIRLTERRLRAKRERGRKILSARESRCCICCVNALPLLSRMMSNYAARRKVQCSLSLSLFFSRRGAILLPRKQVCIAVTL